MNFSFYNLLILSSIKVSKLTMHTHAHTEIKYYLLPILLKMNEWMKYFIFFIVYVFYYFSKSILIA